MYETTLSTKQAYFLECFQEAAGKSITALAEQEQLTLTLHYNYRYLLRAKGMLDPARSSRHNVAAARKTVEANSFLQIAAPQAHNDNYAELRMVCVITHVERNCGMRSISNQSINPV